MADQPSALQGGPLHVTVAVCTAPRTVQEHALVLPAGATVHQALQACGVALAQQGHEGGDGEDCAVGIWGRKAPAGAALQDGDRVEVYRPLLVDPKVARRERFARQGARTVGLFARQRPGAKAGY